MTLDEFKRLANKRDAPPKDLLPALEALWYDRKGNWRRAHEVAQEISSREGAWVHAYLHRKEGDLSNARYWYRRAGRPESRESLEREWEEIVEYLLGESGRSG